MNAGLGTLEQLKAHLLTAALRPATDYDAAILNLGRGVAALFENRCNRKFMRTVNAQEIVPADRVKHVVQRYPIEVITTLEVQQVEQDGWAVLSNLVVNHLADAGLIYFYGQQGWQRGLLRLTYTGGYFWEQLESTDVGYPTVQPVGSALLPDDLRYAWLLQCEATWQLRDKLGLSIGEPQETRRQLNLGSLQLVPQVTDTLAAYTRYQMS